MNSSMSVCSFVFRFVGDGGIYVANADLMDKIGGELYHGEQENKVVVSCIHQTLLNKDINPIK
jgi:hypothetical protein